MDVLTCVCICEDTCVPAGCTYESMIGVRRCTSDMSIHAGVCVCV